MELTGIILAGGQSRRMGQDKCLLGLSGGQTMLEQVIRVLEKSGAQNIIISANSEKYLQLGYPVVSDEFPDSGPLGGIYSALKISPTDLNLLAPCDMPLLKPQLYEYLLQFAGEFDIVLPADSSRVYPLNAVIRKSVLPQLEKTIEDKRLKVTDFFSRLKNKVVRVDSLPFYTPLLLSNINTPDEYARLREIIS